MSVSLPPAYEAQAGPPPVDFVRVIIPETGAEWFCHPMTAEANDLTPVDAEGNPIEPVVEDELEDDGADDLDDPQDPDPHSGSVAPE